MNALNGKTLLTSQGEKTISVHVCDIRNLDVNVDVLTVSAFYRSYSPVQGTMFEALKEKSIDVASLAIDPAIDLRTPCNIWLSKEINDDAQLPVKRIGCIEMSKYTPDRQFWRSHENMILAFIQTYFRMLDIASVIGIPIETIAMPILGTGAQEIPADFIIAPLLNECSAFLKRNAAVKRLMVFTHNQSSAFNFAMKLEQSYSFLDERVSIEKAHKRRGAEVRRVFISYSHVDKNIADNLCSKIENRGMSVWYAPRDVNSGDYASAIVRAIKECTHFIVILSKNSILSNHVLNEIDLAFNELQRGLKILPLKIDEEEIGPAFLYYLSRQHWMDAQVPPLESRLDEFVSTLNMNLE